MWILIAMIILLANVVLIRNIAEPLSITQEVGGGVLQEGD